MVSLVNNCLKSIFIISMHGINHWTLSLIMILHMGLCFAQRTDFRVKLLVLVSKLTTLSPNGSQKMGRKAPKGDKWTKAWSENRWILCEGRGKVGKWNSYLWNKIRFWQSWDCSPSVDTFDCMGGREVSKFRSQKASGLNPFFKLFFSLKSYS